MVKTKLQPAHLFIELVQGVGGPSLVIGDGNSGHRIAGEKPWAGGRTIYQFQVSMGTLRGILDEYAEKLLGDPDDNV